MNVHGTPYRTIWIDTHNRLCVIDQRVLPHTFTIMELADFNAVCTAIADMTVRGAGLIGATAAFGMWKAAQAAPQHSPDAVREHMRHAAAQLKATRPTASNLAWAVDRILNTLSTELTQQPDQVHAIVQRTQELAQAIADEDAASCARIGEHGKTLLADRASRLSRPLNILTHCNAGWLAFVDHGSALAPVYAAHNAGIPVHVWVDETRPRNQGASLTAWELAEHGVPHTLIADNAGGHLMQHGLVDMVITGADRVTRHGDAANKIGTYLKALAAHDNQIPFYVALPSSTFDFSMGDGVREIPIEERDADEVRWLAGKTSAGEVTSVQVCPDATPARNWAFDVTPARLITGLICERGVCPASEEGVLGLFPEQRR